MDLAQTLIHFVDQVRLIFGVGLPAFAGMLVVLFLIVNWRRFRS